MPLTIMAWLCSFINLGDDKHPLLNKWPESIVRQCHEKSHIPYLSEEEQNTHFFLNLARANPRLFYDTFVTAYKDSMLVNDNFYFRSLKSDMYKANAMPLLEGDILLFEAAKSHANEMGRTGKTGHSDVSGSPYYERMNVLANKYEKLLESCQYGYSSGLFVVLDLLVDDGIPDLGHRKALLDNKAVFVGISMQKHKKYGTNTVIEMAYKRI